MDGFIVVGGIVLAVVFVMASYSTLLQRKSAGAFNQTVPKYDESLALAKESVALSREALQLQREALSLQREANRFLAKLAGEDK